MEQKKTISGQGVCIQAAFIAWLNIQKHCWRLSLNCEKKEWELQYKWWRWRQLKFPNLSTIKADWPSTTPPAGLFVHRVLSFALGLTNPRACEGIADAMDFIVSVVGWKVLEPTGHQDYNLNMDQTPVPFTYNARKTLEIVGRCTVHIRKVYRRYQACNLRDDSHCNRKGFETGNCF